MTMHSITILIHVVMALATMAWCKTKFIIPPSSNLIGTATESLSNAKLVGPGYQVEIAWETDLDEAILKIYQIGEYEGGLSAFRSKEIEIVRTKKGGEGVTYWNAEYDLLELATGNQTSIYWFALWEVGKNQVARSEILGVIAPETAETTSISVLVTSTSLQEVSSSTASIETTVIGSSAGTSPGLSRGEIAGVTAGSILGGLLILSSLGWLVWRRLARRNPETIQFMHQERQISASETKSELPGDSATHPSEYARSQPGLHEAP